MKLNDLSISPHNTLSSRIAETTPIFAIIDTDIGLTHIEWLNIGMIYGINESLSVQLPNLGVLV